MTSSLLRVKLDLTPQIALRVPEFEFRGSSLLHLVFYRYYPVEPRNFQASLQYSSYHYFVGFDDVENENPGYRVAAESNKHTRARNEMNTRVCSRSSPNLATSAAVKWSQLLLIAQDYNKGSSKDWLQ